jgi:hypothetical protein
MDWKRRGTTIELFPFSYLMISRKRLEKGYLLTKKEQADSVLFKEKEDE